LGYALSLLYPTAMACSWNFVQFFVILLIIATAGFQLVECKSNGMSAAKALA
jgi:hypothetical protein